MRLDGIGYACAAPALSAVHSSNVPPSNDAGPQHVRADVQPRPATAGERRERGEREGTGDARAFHRNPSEAPALAPIHRYGVWPATPCGNA